MILHGWQRRRGGCCSVTAVNEEDDQRADDLERALDEGDVRRAAKMASRWSTANAQVALEEVQRRNDAHRQDALAGAPAAAGAIDGAAFSLRDEDLSSVRSSLEANAG
jgi:hypothetical protein